ncbi:MFS transporter [Acrocarpospora catenulata]|uniref:MFS transporter n=1 Tax=Acrocarpospora catenulata TaxID=2836182 RepID=UPI001BDB3EA7|nr:MFS transporter [Acrocarpospora catenulata]
MGERIPPAFRRSVALFTLCLTQAMNSSDVTIVNVALPEMRLALGFGTSTVSWVLNGYLVALTATLLIAGRLCDVFGPRRIFLLGVTVFVVASASCGLSASAAGLVLSRVGQGFGASLATAVELAILARMYTREGARAKALSIITVGSILGSSFGLVVGGAITHWMGWRWIFGINVALGLAVLVLGRVFLTADAVPARREIGVVPGVFVAGGLAAWVTAIVSVGESGRPSTFTGIMAVAGTLSLAGFALAQRIGRAELVPLWMLRSRPIIGSGVVLGIASACLLGQFFLQTQYLQSVLHYDSWDTGLAFIPINVAIGLVSLGLARPLIDRFGAGRVVVVAMLVLAAGLAVYARQPSSGLSYWVDVLPPMLLIGFGGGLSTVAATVAALAGAEPHNAGVVSGLIKFLQMGGGIVGIAVFASVVAIAGIMAVTASAGPATFAAGLHAAFLTASGLALAGATIAGFAMRRA